ncbi:peroxiredoxin family protein [Halomarina halobia]|uniref:Peroxiredoxin family protein n=1 Tax=Halomarina halobia TaxID=3033386 RepID=A0ABD6A633_9EURY|nr:peroxiredoxin family protein [Halomarina sp. PSR21]
MPPTPGDRAPDFESLLCTGETFRSTRLSAAFDGGGVLVFSAFAFSAIAENWWKRYDRAGWDEFDVPVLGVSRDGPYAVNAFVRYLDSPFRMFADVDGAASEAYDLLTPRSGMANASTPMRAVFVVDEERTVRDAWVADDWISPVPREAVEEAVAEL